MPNDKNFELEDQLDVMYDQHFLDKCTPKKKKDNKALSWRLAEMEYANLPEKDTGHELDLS
jgi:hypothetical protein